MNFVFRDDGLIITDVRKDRRASNDEAVERMRIVHNSALHVFSFLPAVPS